MLGNSNNLNPQDQASTFDRAVKSGGWSAFSRTFQRLITFIRLAILARLLSRADFGMIGITLLITGGINHFTATGFKNALIQKKKDISDFLDTAWSIELIRGTILFLILFLVAPVLVRLFDGKNRFTRTDFSNPPVFIKQLADNANPVSEYFTEQFPAELRDDIYRLSSSNDIPEDVIEKIQAELNNIINDDEMFLDKCFAEIELSSYSKSLIQQPDNTDIVRLNKRIVEETYSNSLNPSIIDIPQAILMIRMVGITLLIGALANIGTLYFIKDLQFHKQIIIEQVGTFVNVTVAVTLALIYRNVWALVFARLSDSAVKCILSYIMHPHRPRFNIDLSKAAEMWGYGKHLLRTNAMKYLILQGDDIFLGWMMGVTTLGMYQAAYRLSNMVASEIGNVIGNVAFPAYAKVQDNSKKLIGGYLKNTQLISLVCFPVTGILFAFAPQVVEFALGAKWLPIVPTVRILSFVGISKTIPIGGIYNALGRPDIPSKLTFARLVIIACSIYPLTKMYGMPGTGLSIMMPAFILKPVHLYLSHKFVKFPMKHFFMLVSIPLASTIASCSLCWLALKYIDAGNTIRLFLAVCLSTAVYITVMLSFDKIYKQYRLVPLVKEIATSLKK